MGTLALLCLEWVLLLPQLVILEGFYRSFQIPFGIFEIKFRYVIPEREGNAWVSWISRTYHTHSVVATHSATLVATWNLLNLFFLASSSSPSNGCADSDTAPL